MSLDADAEEVRIGVAIHSWVVRRRIEAISGRPNTTCAAALVDGS
jgi:hypothetical protein